MVKAETPHSSYTVWLNPTQGYTISKAKIHLGPGTTLISNDRILESHQYSEFMLDAVQYQIVDGIYVPISYSLKQKEFRGKVPSKHVNHVKITDIKLNPDHAKLGSFELPWYEGHRAYDRYLDLSYTWHSGKLIADICDTNGRSDIIIMKDPNSSRVDSLLGYSEQGGKGVLWALVGMLVVGSCVGLYWVRGIKARME